jgi:hypothetical protein
MTVVKANYFFIGFQPAGSSKSSSSAPPNWCTMRLGRFGNGAPHNQRWPLSAEFVARPMRGKDTAQSSAYFEQR